MPAPPILSPLFVPVLAMTNLITVFLRCDPIGQVICCGLGVFSIIAWAVMIGKRNELTALRRLNHSFDQRLRDERRVLDLPESFRSRRSIPYADLCTEAIEAYWRAAAIGKEKGMDTSRFRLEHAENALQRALARQTLRYESSMIFLASIVSGAPFLGLLGTVWGVMDAFSAVSLQQTASIQTLAPGVSARPADHDLRPGGRDPVGLRLQLAPGQDPRHDHGAGELRELAGRPHRAREPVNDRPTRNLRWHAPFARQRQAHPIAEMNVTNLIDLGFTLLIIFMITTPLIKQEQTIPVNLPIGVEEPADQAGHDDHFVAISDRRPRHLLSGKRRRRPG